MKIKKATNNDCRTVTDLIYQILADYGLKHDPEKTDADISNIESSYTNNGGMFDVLEDEKGNIVGTVGLYKIDNEVCELRKMYLHKSQRGKGLGKYLLEHALNRAKELGYTKVILETASVLKEAISLYESYGFKQYHPEHISGRCDKAYYLEINGTKLN